MLLGPMREGWISALVKDRGRDDATSDVGNPSDSGGGETGVEALPWRLLRREWSAVAEIWSAVRETGEDRFSTDIFWLASPNGVP